MFSLSLYAAFFALVNSLFPALWTAMGSRRVVQEEISQNRVKKKKQTKTPANNRYGTQA